MDQTADQGQKAEMLYVAAELRAWARDQSGEVKGRALTLATNLRFLSDQPGELARRYLAGRVAELERAVRAQR